MTMNCLSTQTHRKAKLQEEEEEYTIEEHQQFYDIKHTAPQHRQYLSNEVRFTFSK